MAGGSGTRFWPLSRKLRPKQLLPIGTESPLIVETAERLDVPADQLYIVAGRHHEAPIRALLPEAQLLIEPCARNTAPCVGLAAIHLRARDPDAVMAVLPADHHISDAPGYRALLDTAERHARRGEIVTLGIVPTRPETGYGYIHYDAENLDDGAHPVHRFVEKPPRELAERYLAGGEHLWNSGMFVFTAARILDDIRRYLPDMAEKLETIAAAIGTPEYDAVLTESFAAVKSVSIDYGVMEHAERITVVPADIGWNDVGHWAAIADFAGELTTGDVVAIDTEETIVHTDGPLVATIGLRGLVVVATGDAVLVCPRDRAQDVRQIVDRLEQDGREELL